MEAGLRDELHQRDFIRRGCLEGYLRVREGERSCFVIRIERVSEGHAYVTVAIHKRHKQKKQKHTHFVTGFIFNRSDAMTYG